MERTIQSRINKLAEEMRLLMDARFLMFQGVYPCKRQQHEHVISGVLGDYTLEDVLQTLTETRTRLFLIGLNEGMAEAFGNPIDTDQ